MHCVGKIFGIEHNKKWKFCSWEVIFLTMKDSVIKLQCRGMTLIFHLTCHFPYCVAVKLGAQREKGRNAEEKKEDCREICIQSNFMERMNINKRRYPFFLLQKEPRKI